MNYDEDGNQYEEEDAENYVDEENMDENMQMQMEGYNLNNGVESGRDGEEEELNEEEINQMVDQGEGYEGDGDEGYEGDEGEEENGQIREYDDNDANMNMNSNNNNNKFFGRQEQGQVVGTGGMGLRGNNNVSNKRPLSNTRANNNQQMQNQMDSNEDYEEEEMDKMYDNDGNPIEITNDNVDLDPNNDPENMSNASSDISLHFFCEIHPNENYTHYSAKHKKLLCAQCLLDFANNNNNINRCLDINDAKSIKKSWSLILQHFEDFLNSVEVNRNLIKNRHNELNIKSDSLRIKIQSLKNKFELKFEELQDSLTEIKNKALEKFENSLHKLFDYNEEVNKELSERVVVFEDILQNIGNIQQNSETANED